jgi:hypothetical protein
MIPQHDVTWGGSPSGRITGHCTACGTRFGPIYGVGNLPAAALKVAAEECPNGEQAEVNRVARAVRESEAAAARARNLAAELADQRRAERREASKNAAFGVAGFLVLVGAAFAIIDLNSPTVYFLLSIVVVVGLMVLLSHLTGGGASGDDEAMGDG